MKQFIYDEGNGLWYALQGNYYIPCLTVPDSGEYQLGKYGRIHQRFLEEHHPVIYNALSLKGTLYQHLAEIDKSCTERMETIVSAMAKQEGVTETLKCSDQLEWVRRMNSIQNRAEEIVLYELVYTV